MLQIIFSKPKFKVNEFKYSAPKNAHPQASHQNIGLESVSEYFARLLEKNLTFKPREYQNTKPDSLELNITTTH